MKVARGSLLGLTSNGVQGPWPCEKCSNLSQFADVQPHVNIIFCRTEGCGYRRQIDKRRFRIVEDDGSVWGFDTNGRKWPIARAWPTELR